PRQFRVIVLSDIGEPAFGRGPDGHQDRQAGSGGGRKQVESRLGGRIPSTGGSLSAQRTGEQRIDAPFDDIDDARGFRRRALGGELIGVDGLSRNDHGRSGRSAQGGGSCDRIEKWTWRDATSV